MRRTLGVIAVFSLSAACSLVTSLDGYTGGVAPQPLGGDASTADAPPGDAVAETKVATSAYASAVLADNPVAYYRFDDVTKDEVGAHPGKATGTIGQTPGALSGDTSVAAVFDGASWLDVGDFLPAAAFAPFSVEAWIKPNASSDPMCFAARSEGPVTGAPVAGWSMYSGSDGTDVRLSRYQTSGFDTATSPIPAGAFVHVVGTYDGATLRTYVDGVPAVTAASTFSLVPPSTHVTVGAGRGGIYCYFHGAVDEVALYDHVLPADRVAAHHRAGLGQP